MAKPRDVLLIDIPGLTVADVTALGPHLPNLHALAREGCATLVPIAAGYEYARQATIATGLLPMHHGVVHSGQTALRAPTFWRRAKATAASFGVSRLLHGRVDAWSAFTQAEGKSRLVFHPPDQESMFYEAAPESEGSRDFTRLFAHFAARAVQAGYRVVCLEILDLSIRKAMGVLHGEAADDGLMNRLDEIVGRVLDSARDRVVALVSSTTHYRAKHLLQVADAPNMAPGDWRLIHIGCQPPQIPAVVDGLSATGAYIRVAHGAARGEMGVDCAEAGTVVAELKPEWAFSLNRGHGVCASGPDSPPEHLPVLLARGLALDKKTIGMCEVAWLLEHALTGREYADDRP